MSQNTSPKPPADLLARCLSTIPQAVSRPDADLITSTVKFDKTPRPIPDAASRRRLLWLGVAAAVPILSLLVILPSQRINGIEKSLIQSTPPPGKNTMVPYVRIHKWERRMMRNGLTAPDHRVVIYDVKRGRSEWQTDDRYQTIKIPTDKTPFASIRATGGSYYTQYHRAGKYCSIKRIKRTTRDGLSGFDWAYNAKALASYYPGGKLSKKEPALWEGKRVEKQEYKRIPGEDQAKKIEELNVRQAVITEEISLITNQRKEIRSKYPRKVENTGKENDQEEKDALTLLVLEKQLRLLKNKLIIVQLEKSYRIDPPNWRAEAYVDAETGLIRAIRSWRTFGDGGTPTVNETLMKEERYYYQPLSTDAGHFDTKRITTDVKLLYGTSKP